MEATEFTISPDPGTFSAAWTVSNSVVTLSFGSMICGNTYTFTTVEAEIIASAGSPTALITTGPQDGDWAFTASTCGASASSPVVISAFEYAGPVCSADNTHSFSVTGSNIDAYLASTDIYFADAEWQTQSIEGSATIDVTVEDADTTVYLALKSDTGTVGSIYSFELDDWSAACNSNEEEVVVEDNEDEELPVDEADEEDEIVVVAGVSPGDIIHSSSSTAVYYVTETYGRRVFINEATFFSWYDSFDVVQEVSAATLSALPLQGNMLPKAGIVLVKIQSSPVVYFLGEGSEYLVPDLREIRDEATAISLFGSTWAELVIDIEPTFFTKFGTGLDVEVNENLGIDLDDMKQRIDLHE